MTTKKVTLADKNPVNKIMKGTVLKGFGDLFMVVEVVRERSEDPVHDALFLTNPPRHITRRRVEAKYSLISLSTGNNFFDSQDSLQELLRKIVDDGRFKIVNEIEFKEI